jgi:hypothetical protein
MDARADRKTDRPDHRGTAGPPVAVRERGQLTALRAAWLFDGTSAALIPDPLVVIEGNAIVAVGSGARAPEGAAVIDLAGATLLPGLIDTHVHLAFDASTDAVGNLERRRDGQAMEAMALAARPRCAAALPPSATSVTSGTCRWHCAAGPVCRRSSLQGRRSPRPAGTATSSAGPRQRRSTACAPRCASAPSVARTLSRSWPAAGT